MSRMKSLLAAALLTLLLPAALLAQEFRYDGWWVVLATFDANAPDRDALEAGAREKLTACGFEAFNDDSMKFDGFAEGFSVVVVWSAFPTQAEAETVREKVKPCFADAYVKKGRHKGE